MILHVAARGCLSHTHSPSASMGTFWNISVLCDLLKEERHILKRFSFVCVFFLLIAPPDKKEKKKKKKEKEKSERKEQAELPSCSWSSRSKTVKEKDDHGPKKHSSKNSERAQKSDYREGKKHHADSPDVRGSFQARTEDPEWEPKKEKPKHDYRSSSRREGEEKSREKDRGRSSGTHSSRHGGHSEGRSHRSRSRSWSPLDKSHKHKKYRHSRERESFHASDRRHY